MTEPSVPAASPERARPPSWVGRRFEAVVGPVAHGGHFVVRHEGRVVFVRHALPGETVEVRVTEDAGGSFCRADAVRVVVAAAERVDPPCRYAHPGGCGGCDFQHISVAAQRALKAAVVMEQFERLAAVTIAVEVAELPPGPIASAEADAVADAAGLGWRRRVRYASTPDGRLGLHEHRSSQVVPLDRCLIAAPGVGDNELLGLPFVLAPGEATVDEVELAVDDDAEVVAVTASLARTATGAGGPGGPGRRSGQGRPDRRGKTGRARRSARRQLSGPHRQHYRVDGIEYEVSPGGFWQTHPSAAETFVRTGLALTSPNPGETVLDLYAGAGLFTAAFARRVGAEGRILGLEGDQRAAADGAANVARWPHAELRASAVTASAVQAAAEELTGPSLLVLDPPRTGAGREIMRAVLATRARAVLYVACDPAALARDVRTALDAGWALTALRAFDAFPMTHHVECLALLTPPR
ncbi:TRAM domain-containing protein [Jatrophihabitans telluris]|uniref:TRAM domain-containing protein n=1 Tax=Jatrophihabitans telluris TaxID=2038343 RepID=A0ABY4QUD8_9ACTN|nr:TRAM domain-containing protein [Jatrophihabitans telluris]UQX86697.1 TRAM domain-containing protein [Jatrophihabitans telluris]